MARTTKKTSKHMTGREVYIAVIGPMWKKAQQYLIFGVIIVSCTEIAEGRLHKNISTAI
jgi:hypothetical protein